MLIYLAAQYRRRAYLCRYREALEAAGHTVTSRWLNGTHEVEDNGSDPLAHEAATIRFAQDDKNRRRAGPTPHCVYRTATECGIQGRSSCRAWHGAGMEQTGLHCRSTARMCFAIYPRCVSLTPGPSAWQPSSLKESTRVPDPPPPLLALRALLHLALAACAPAAAVHRWRDYRVARRLETGGTVSMWRLLDLFCGGGGASMGYSSAGFEVTGVDHLPQKHYPFTFVQGDALEYLAAHGHEYAALHASPPCQAYSSPQASHHPRSSEAHRSSARGAPGDAQTLRD